MARTINFKGVASLFGSRTSGYKTAVTWATVTTFAGLVCSVFLAQALLKTFSGRGLVPDPLVSSEHFLLAMMCWMLKMESMVTTRPMAVLTFPVTPALLMPRQGLLVVAVDIDLRQR